MENKDKKELLKVSGLKVYYASQKSKGKPVKAVDGISFSVYEGETFGIVGESGCGKSTTGRAIVSLIKPTEGEILFKGQSLSGFTRKDRLHLAKNLQLIFQDSASSLDPRFTIGKTIEEPLSIHKLKDSKKRKEIALKLMIDVGLREEYYDRFPHEFSGGQRQRIGIARALALNPSLIVCDEPVSALDVSIQAQVINLLKKLQKQLGLTYIFITHDLSVVNYFSDDISVMYLGQMVEKASAKELFHNPIHPYTEALLSAIPIPEVGGPKRERIILKGEITSPVNLPDECRFAKRCAYVTEECLKGNPELREMKPGHFVACCNAEKFMKEVVYN